MASLLRAVLLLGALWGAPASPADVDETARQVEEKTNAFRSAEGREAVAPDARLARAAREFARYMAQSGKYGHTADGRQPVERAAAHGYEHCIVSENIAYVYRSSGFESGPLAEEMIAGWKNSPGHRRNMLDAAVTQIGVGIAQDAAGRYYGVQMFGRPRALAIRFGVRNDAGQSVAYRLGERRFSLPPRSVREHTTCRATELAIEAQPPFRQPPRDGATYIVVRRAGALAVLPP